MGALRVDPQIVESVRQLFVLFPAHVTLERIEFYASMLKDFSASDVSSACEATVKVWTKTFPPPVGVIRDRATQARRARLSGPGGSLALPEGKPKWWGKFKELMDGYRERTGRSPSMKQRQAYLDEAELSCSGD